MSCHQQCWDLHETIWYFEYFDNFRVNLTAIRGNLFLCEHIFAFRWNNFSLDCWIWRKKFRQMLCSFIKSFFCRNYFRFSDCSRLLQRQRAAAFCQMKAKTAKWVWKWLDAFKVYLEQLLKSEFNFANYSHFTKRSTPAHCSATRLKLTSG